MANSLDLDQDLGSVSPDLGPNFDLTHPLNSGSV